MHRSFRSFIRCPICGSTLTNTSDKYTCSTDSTHTFPYVNSVPVLIDDAKSVFQQKDFVNGDVTFFQSSRESFIKRLFQALTPSISKNYVAEQNIKRLQKLLRQIRSPKILVIGGSIIGQGMEALLNDPRIQCIETDVSMSERVHAICDAHQLPFKNACFDAVIAQAVLEHVTDPQRVVEELHRVVKPKGYIYAETPFMQPVHGKAYDFTRFTFLGHRRLFRAFEEIDMGACCGPGMSLAWSWWYFLRSFSASLWWHRISRFVSGWTAWWLVYLDRFILATHSGLDAASGYYFLGRKSATTLPDRDIIRLYPQ